jgi:CheY-like chemotaxis protein
MAGKKLLVADDSLTIQKVIRLALSNEGYEIQAVSDGNAAVQQISLFRPDAILIDVSLPGKSAFEVKRAVNEHSDLEEIRFILMSSAFEKVDESQAEEVRFHGRLTKPFDPAHLRQVLTDTLAQVAAKRGEPTSWLERPKPTETEIPLPEAPQDEEDWSTPVQAEDQIVVAPPPPVKSEAANDEVELWDDKSAQAPQELPPELPSHGSDRDADIKHLTESTIRMSGLDDYQWSVNEPSLKPSPELLDNGGSNFEIEPSHSVDAEKFPPFKPEAFQRSTPPAPDADTDLELDSISLGSLPDPSAETQHAASPADFYRKPDATPAVPPRPAASEASSVAISSIEIEDMLRKELRKELQKLLPDLAEKIIKQEIHKMLSESPS